MFYYLILVLFMSFDPTFGLNNTLVLKNAVREAGNFFYKEILIIKYNIVLNSRKIIFCWAFFLVVYKEKSK